MNTVFLLRLTEKVYVHVNLDFKRQMFSKRDFIVAVLADVFRYCLFFIQENSANWYLLALLLFGCNWLKNQSLKGKQLLAIVKLYITYIEAKQGNQGDHPEL